MSLAFTMAVFIVKSILTAKYVIEIYGAWCSYYLLLAGHLLSEWVFTAQKMKEKSAIG